MHRVITEIQLERYQPVTSAPASYYLYLSYAMQLENGKIVSDSNTVGLELKQKERLDEVIKKLHNLIKALEWRISDEKTQQ